MYIVLCPIRKIFTFIRTSLWPVKGFKFSPFTRRFKSWSTYTRYDTGPRFNAVSSEGPPHFGVASEGWVGGWVGLIPTSIASFPIPCQKANCVLNSFKDICYIPITAFRTNSSEVCKQI